MDQQWGAQVLFAGVYQLGGWTGLVDPARAAGRGDLRVRCSRSAGGADWARDGRPALTFAAFVVSAVALALRPQLLGMALFAAILLLVVDRRAHPGRLWAIPVVVAVWANLHGSFFLGPLVLGLAWLEDVHERAPGSRRTLLVAVVSAAAACLTPFGPTVWAYAVGLSTNPQVTERITRVAADLAPERAGHPVLRVGAAVVVLIARRGARTSWPTLAWLGGRSSAIGAYAIRGVAWWPLGAVAAIAGDTRHGAVDPTAVEARADPPLIRRLNVVVAGALVVAGIALLPVWRPTRSGAAGARRRRRQRPPGITAALRDLARPGDRLFNPQPWGSWFEFTCRDLPVAIDSRIEVFPAEVWDTYERVVAGVDGWQATARRVGRDGRRRGR